MLILAFPDLATADLTSPIMPCGSPDSIAVLLLLKVTLTMQAKGKEFKAAAKVQPPPSEAIRQLAASTLISHLEASGRAAPHGKAAKPEEGSGAVANGAPKDGEGGAKAKPQEKVHEKRSENVALAEAVEFVATAQEAPVSICNLAAHHSLDRG